MPSIAPSDLQRMRDELLFDGPDRTSKLTRFWTLLTLAAVIASAGVVGDSTAAVIGAMIVAPLMTPILGAVLSVVTADRTNLVRSIGLVLGGAALVVAVGWVVGLFHAVPVTAATNSQVAIRIHPRLIDLVAALATGAVGAFALVRDDVGDTLPGVAIAISLVPPLAVVGLTLESGAPSEAAGALLLFVTNVTAILASGVVVMALYRVHHTASSGAHPSAALSRARAGAVIAILVAVVAVPLGITSATIVRETLTQTQVTSVATAWAEPVGWEIVSVEIDGGEAVVRALGPAPVPDVAELRSALDAEGLGDVDLLLQLVPEQRIELPGD